MVKKKKVVKKKVLGKGLNALIPGKITKEKTVNGILELSVDEIIRDEKQPRVMFNQEKLDELCQSIKEHGVLQPIRVAKEEDKYKIIYGERRFRACKKLKLKTIPAIISNKDEEENSLIALIENIQREDLNIIEEAEGYQKLINNFKLTQDEVAKKVGKSRSAIANLLRILKLPSEIKEMVINKTLSMGHVRSLLALENIERQIYLAEKASRESLSVRQMEAIVYKPEKKEKKSEKEDIEIIPKDPHLLKYTENLQHKFGCKINFKGDLKKGKLELFYSSSDDLNRILEILKVVE